MANIVLVPGGYHGGWYYSPLLPALRAAGHAVYTISLSGLDGPATRPRMAINLDTHIEDVVSLIEQEQLDDVVLCGHSYAGMVIAGVADRVVERIRTLLFIDAIVPSDGDSVWSLWPDEVCAMFIATAPDGLVTGPPPGVDSRARAPARNLYPALADQREGLCIAQQVFRALYQRQSQPVLGVS